MRPIMVPPRQSVASDLSGRGQRLRGAAAAADERPGQGCRDLGPASSARGPAEATWSSTGRQAQSWCRPPDEIGRQPGQGLFAGQHDAERGDSGRVQPGDHCHQYDGGPRSFSMYSRRLSGDSANQHTPLTPSWRKRTPEPSGKPGKLRTTSQSPVYVERSCAVRTTPSSSNKRTIGSCC